MAITSYLGNSIEVNTNTFENWLARTNQLSQDMGTKVVSAEATAGGGVTTGNTVLNGIFSANTIAVGTELRGGTLSTPAGITISSNVSITGTESVINTVNHTVSSNTFVLGANTLSVSSSGIGITTDTISFNVTDTISFNSTRSIKLPVGTTAQRNPSPVQGDIRFNTDIIKYEGYDGTEWKNIGGIDPFTYNDVTDTYTLAAPSDLVIEADLSAGSGTFTNVVTALDFNSTSDIKYKENVKPIDNALDLIEMLEGISFTWKDSGRDSYGLIAQQVAKIEPKLVATNDEGDMSVYYQGVIPILIESIKILSNRLKEINDKNAI